jgi:serine/threonine-protein kinase RsbW
MSAESAAKFPRRLTIQSRLDQLEFLWPWAESLAEEHAASNETRFAIHLCLEEAVSNVIRHGYGGQPDRPITIEFAAEPDVLAFSVEDQAQPFDPLSQPATEETPAPVSIDEIPLGGRGIQFLKKFAGGLAYEPLPGGNRLILRFRVGR